MNKQKLRLAAKIALVIGLVALGYYIAVARGHRDPLPSDVAPPMPQARAAYDRVVGTGALICGVYPWPPYFAFDPNTFEPTGLIKELGDAIGEILGLRVEYIESLVGNQVADLKNSRIDAHCFDAPLVYQTMKYLDYSRPLFFVPADVYGRAPRQLNSPSTRFLAMEGDISQTLAHEHFPKAVVFTRSATEDPAVLMLDVAMGKADAIIMDAFAIESFNKSNPKTPLRKLTATPLTYFPTGLTTFKGDQALYNMFDAAIRLLQTRGDLQRIIRKYDPTGTRLILPATDFIPPSAR